VTIERLSAATRNGGTLSASGRVRIDPAAGFPGDIRITGQRAELASNEFVTTSADLALALSGPLSRDPRVTGQVRILSMDVTIPESLPVTVRPIPGTRHVQPTPTAVRRLALAARTQANARSSPAFNATLDLVVSAPNRIFVRGRGIDAELGGDLRLSGSLRDPVAIGAFDLRRGRLTVVGTRLDFTRGRLTFTGDLTPELDFLAETRAADVTARIGVTGTARQPQFAFTSDPDGGNLPGHQRPGQHRRQGRSKRRTERRLRGHRRDPAHPRAGRSRSRRQHRGWRRGRVGILKRRTFKWTHPWPFQRWIHHRWGAELAEFDFSSDACLMVFTS
jgi:autotransporter translocation and assembly factor TamB